MKNHIFVLSRSNYKRVVTGLSNRQKDDSAFIQINEPTHGVNEMFGGSIEPVLPDSINVLNLWFDDAEEDYSGTLKVHGVPLEFKTFLFDEEMAEKIYSFTMNNRQAKVWFLHCTAGISRSGAVGDVLSEYFGIEYKDFKYHNPQIRPNALVKSLLRKKFFYE